MADTTTRTDGRGTATAQDEVMDARSLATNKSSIGNLANDAVEQDLRNAPEMYVSCSSCLWGKPCPNMLVPTWASLREMDGMKAA